MRIWLPLVQISGMIILLTLHIPWFTNVIDRIHQLRQMSVKKHNAPTQGKGPFGVLAQANYFALTGQTPWTHQHQVLMVTVCPKHDIKKNTGSAIDPQMLISFVKC